MRGSTQRGDRGDIGVGGEPRGERVQRFFVVARRSQELPLGADLVERLLHAPAALDGVLLLGLLGGKQNLVARRESGLLDQAVADDRADLEEVLTDEARHAVGGGLRSGDVVCDDRDAGIVGVARDPYPLLAFVEGHEDQRGLCGDGGLYQIDHLVGVAVSGLVRQLQVAELGRVLTPLQDLRPKRVTRRVVVGEEIRIAVLGAGSEPVLESSRARRVPAARRGRASGKSERGDRADRENERGALRGSSVHVFVSFRWRCFELHLNAIGDTDRMAGRTKGQ